MTTTEVRPSRTATAEPAGRRRWHPAAVGLLVAAAALGIFVVLTPTSPHSQRVLAVRAPVAAGAQVTPSDVTVVNVTNAARLAVIPAGQEASVVGRPAAVALVAGQLLAPADIGPPAAATAQVGLALAAGEYPPNLAAGETVQVVLGQASTNGALLGSASRSVGAVVVSVTASGSRADEVLVTVAVSPLQAEAVAAAAAVGAVVVIGS